MSFIRRFARSSPLRLATGAYILHSGLEKSGGSPEQAQGLHGMASGTYPFLSSVPPTRFLRLLSTGEILLGSMLLAPVVSNRLAGAGLTAFSGGLVATYLRTPGLHEPGSIWPTHQGIALSKDVWMLGIGVSLALDPKPAG
jgi:uncharacterized membrane protein YphA (DoxX/SURF4 family)